ncbi:hypothetical protein CCB80_13540 [Armatimonadetes bacterium Uphvl-Ar1]|nr:hypothetical protein CCB80_13540 [Armatimonadetes bacterium Uphvl-Ar1]
MKRIWIFGGITLALILAVCGIGGFFLYRGLVDSAGTLEPEFRRSKENQIPLVWADLEPPRALEPNRNAALDYKSMFDLWQAERPKFTDERWDSFIRGQGVPDDRKQIQSALNGLIPLFESASTKSEVQWQIDYSQRAFTSYPVFASVVDANEINLQKNQKRFDARSVELDQIKDAFRVSDHILASNDPGSLRAAARIRMSALEAAGRSLTETLRGEQDTNSYYKALLAILDQIKPIDPLPVWRKTAFLQFITWDEYEKLTADQRELFAASRRDHDLIIDSATSEILKFWNDALVQAKGETQLGQQLLLGERVLRLRDRADVAALPLKKLWTLDSATKGAASIDWLIAEEQLQLLRQVLDILITTSTDSPSKFTCQRKSVIGEKLYAYEKTASGFRITATPSDRLVPESALAQRKLTYEFAR